MNNQIRFKVKFSSGGVEAIKNKYKDVLDINPSLINVIFKNEIDGYMEYSMYELLDLVDGIYGNTVKEGNSLFEDIKVCDKSEYTLRFKGHSFLNK